MKLKNEENNERWGRMLGFLSLTIRPNGLLSLVLAP
jgi:hypothetical protein